LPTVYALRHADLLLSLGERGRGSVIGRIPPSTMSNRTPLLADRMLGKLARLLRMVGQDVEYVREGEPFEIARRAERERRVFLTRDKRLASRRDLGSILYVENNYPFHQARQVIRDLDLEIDSGFRRCVEDNGLLELAAKETVGGAVPPYVLETATALYRCARCARVYWEGTHVEAMRGMIAALKDEPLVPGDGDIDAHGSTDAPLVTLEPLVDLHRALEVLFLRHRLALMDAEVGRALKMLRRFNLCMRRHIEDERALIFPLYQHAAPAAGYEKGAHPDIFENEHRKILDHMERMEASTEALEEEAGGAEKLRARCLQLLDREKVFADLLEHHDLRERTYLYPAVEEILAEEEKLDLLERMIGLEVTDSG
jgi:uncharacterized protein with PIN domain